MLWDSITKTEKFGITMEVTLFVLPLEEKTKLAHTPSNQLQMLITVPTLA